MVSDASILVVRLREYNIDLLLVIKILKYF